MFEMERMKMIRILLIFAFFSIVSGCDGGVRKIFIPSEINDLDKVSNTEVDDDSSVNAEDVKIDDSDDFVSDKDYIDFNDEDTEEYDKNESSDEENDNDDDFFDVPSDPSPVDLEGIVARFHADVSYDSNSLNRFDIFIARTKTPAPLVIYIHGGGFTAGDKKDAYDGGGPFVIRELLRNGVAFASVNYRLLEQKDPDGVIKPLLDCKRALQFIRYNAEILNIDKEKIAVYGFSAGAGASLWIGFNEDMADPDSPDPILKESTRISGIAALETQATYDLVRWETEIFKPYDITLKSFVNLGLGATLYSFYGISSLEEMYNPEITRYREKVDMLDLMTPDDPEIFVNNAYDNAGKPINLYALYHHPYQATALKDMSEKVGIKGLFYVPSLNISDPSNEELIPFLLRKLGK